MAQVAARLKRAEQIIDYLLEGGHNINDVCEEFCICRSTVTDAMKLYANWGYGNELKRRRILYKKAMAEVEKTNAIRRARRG